MENNSAHPKTSTHKQPLENSTADGFIWQDTKNGMAILMILATMQNNWLAMQNSQPAIHNDQHATQNDQQAILNDQPQPAGVQPGRDGQQVTSGNLQNEYDPRAAIENNVVEGKKASQENQAYGSRCYVNGNQARGEGTKQANTAASDSATFAFSKVNDWLLASLLLCLMLQATGLAPSVKDLAWR